MKDVDDDDLSNVEADEDQFTGCLFLVCISMTALCILLKVAEVCLKNLP